MDIFFFVFLSSIEFRFRIHHKLWFDLFVLSVIVLKPINGRLLYIVQLVLDDLAHLLHWIAFYNKLKFVITLTFSILFTQWEKVNTKKKTELNDCVKTQLNFRFLFFFFGNFHRTCLDGANGTAIYMYLSMFNGCSWRQRKSNESTAWNSR